MSRYELKNEGFDELNKESKIVIITSEFNEDYTSKLELINKNYLIEKGFKNIKTYKVPGALEIPGFANKLLSSENNNIDLIICLGVIIKGDTPHFDYVCSGSATGILNLSIKYTIPIINGILTCLNEKQVEERVRNNYAVSGLKILREYKRN